jgi:hypothetical protein
MIPNYAENNAGIFRLALILGAVACLYAGKQFLDRFDTIEDDGLDWPGPKVGISEQRSPRHSPLFRPSFLKIVSSCDAASTVYIPLATSFTAHPTLIS